MDASEAYMCAKVRGGWYGCESQGAQNGFKEV